MIKGPWTRRDEGGDFAGVFLAIFSLPDTELIATSMELPLMLNENMQHSVVLLHLLAYPAMLRISSMFTSDVDS
jgi:hypothetical protein